MNRYERLQRRRLDQQQSTSDSATMSDVPANCETIESTSPLEEYRSEAADNSTSQDASVSDHELENDETLDAVSESDNVTTEGNVEVENLDFSDEMIADSTCMAEENVCSDNDVNSPLSSSTTSSLVEQESLCDSNTSAKQAIDPEDSLETRMELLEKLKHQQWLYSLVKAELDAKLISSSPSRMLENDDKRTHYFTGLPSYSVFATLLELLSKAIKPYLHFGISPGDQLLMVLMKLRHADPFQTLGYYFGVDITRVSKIFHHWMNIMHEELQPLIKWPERDMLRKTLPACFKPKYLRTTCIIDCSEIFIQRPTSLTARAQTYSNYKSHNTVKFLIAVSPTGAVTFVSKCWGGRASDKHITAHSGFLKKLMHGDLVLADRGFDIAEALACHGATLAIPPFTKGKPQLSCREVETARELSRVWIHVERAIGRLKNYKLLKATLPISLIKNPRDQGHCTIDKILFVCCALCNLQPPLIA